MEQIPHQENKRFKSLKELREHFEQLFEAEKGQVNVSHLTFGEAFNVYDLMEEDLETWNLAQDFFEDKTSYEIFLENFRDYQVGLANEQQAFSSRGKFSSYLSNLVMKKYAEDSRQVG